MNTNKETSKKIEEVIKIEQEVVEVEQEVLKNTKEDIVVKKSETIGKVIAIKGNMAVVEFTDGKETYVKTINNIENKLMGATVKL